LSQQHVSRTINHDTFDRRTVADIQKKFVKWDKRGAVFRHFHAKKDKEAIADWGVGPRKDSSGLQGAFYL